MAWANRRCSRSGPQVRFLGFLAPRVAPVADRGRSAAEGGLMDEEQLIQRLRTIAPTCLRNANATPSKLPEPFDNNPFSVWQIACRCGGAHGKFLGYSLRDYNSEYDGPECFLSPLAFECAACKAVTELLVRTGTVTTPRWPGGAGKRLGRPSCEARVRGKHSVVRAATRRCSKLLSASCSGIRMSWPRSSMISGRTCSACFFAIASVLAALRYRSQLISASCRRRQGGPSDRGRITVF